MGRTIRDYVFPSPPPQILADTIHNYLMGQGYSFKQRGAEGIYQKGAGLTMGPTFLKFTIMGNGARIEGWQEYAILPGVYAGEIDIDSFIGIAVKGPLRDRFMYMESLIMQYGGRPSFPGMGYAPVSNIAPSPQMPQGGYPPVQGGYQQVVQNGYQQPYAAPQPYAVPQPYAAPQTYADPQPYADPQSYAESQPQASKFCSNCGTPATDGMNFCTKCGTQLG